MASKEQIIEKIEALTRLVNDYSESSPLSQAEWRRKEMRREIHALEWAIGKRRNWSSK